MLQFIAEMLSGKKVMHFQIFLKYTIDVTANTVTAQVGETSMQSPGLYSFT